MFNKFIFASKYKNMYLKEQKMMLKEMYNESEVVSEEEQELKQKVKSVKNIAILLILLYLKFFMGASFIQIILFVIAYYIIKMLLRKYVWIHINDLFNNDANANFSKVSSQILEDNKVDKDSEEWARFYYYHSNINMFKFEKDLENFFKDSASLSKSSSIVTINFMNSSKLDNFLGEKSLIRVVLNNAFKRNKVTTTSDFYIDMMSCIPQKLDIATNEAVYSKNNVAYFDIRRILTQNTSFYEFENTKYKEFLVENFASNFTDLQHLEKERLENKRLEDEKQRKIREKEELQKYVIRYNLPEVALSILTKINKNKDKWQFYYWNQNTEGITGNKDYLSIKCKMLNNQNIDKITNLKTEIESVLGKKVIIQSDINDANSFTLLVMFKQAIAQFKLSARELMEYTSKNKLFIGRGLTGDITVDFDDNAYHSLTGGGSGSGKSVDLQADIFQMLTLRDYKYQHAVVVSGGKLADFQNMGLASKRALMLNAGENLDVNGHTVLTEEQSIEKIYEYIKMLEWELNKRENLFLNNQVANLGEYNKKFPQKEMGRILFVADEWESLRRIAKRYKNAETKKDYDDLIMMSVSNLFSKGRSGGLNIKVATQDFTADTIGVIRRQFTTLKLGVGDKNTYSSYNGQALASYFAEMTRTGQKTEGTFFMQSAKMKFNTPPVEFSNNFSMLRTPYVDASDLRKAIQTNVEDFETDKLYKEYKNLFEEKNKSEGVNKPQKPNEIDLNLIN